MIGNDIVDLNYAKKQSNWRRKGYLDKIYTQAEQELIASYRNPDVMIWILWSMKEAAYKANHRITNRREYAPKKIECSIVSAEHNIFRGTCGYNNLQYNCTTLIFEDYVSSIALHDQVVRQETEEIFLKNYPENYVEYLENNNYFAPAIKIVKDLAGIPYFYNQNTKEFQPISISHHGDYFSLVFFKK